MQASSEAPLSSTEEKPADDPTAQQGGPVSFADPAIARKQLRRLALAVVAVSLLVRYLPSTLPTVEDLYRRARFFSYDLVLQAQAELTVRGWMERREPSQVAVVGIDEQALNAYGRWPWNRSLLAELIKGIHGVGPSAIGVDILLAEPDRGPVDEMRRILEGLPEEGRTGRLGELYDSLQALRSEGDDGLRDALAAARGEGEWLFSPEGHDAYLEKVLRDSGNVVLGTILEFGHEQGATIDWLEPGETWAPPPQVLEAYRLGAGELPADRLEAEWKMGMVPQRLAAISPGFSALEVGGLGGMDLSEQGGTMGQLQGLGRVRIRGQGGGEVRGLYIPRGSFLHAAAGSGFMNDDTAGDGVVRSFSMAQSLGGKLLPSLGLQALATSRRSEIELWLSHYREPEAIHLVREERPEVIIPCDSSTTVWLNVYPPPSEGEANYPSIRFLSAASILDATRSGKEEDLQALREELGGRVVFLGVTALGLSDMRLSPLGLIRPGVENHATLVANLLNGEQLHLMERELLLSVLLTLVMLLILSFVLPRIPPERAVFLAMTLVVAAFGVCLVAIRFGSILFPLDLITPLLAFFVIGILYLNRFENRDKAWIDQMFKRYVSPEYVEQIKRNKGQLDLHGREARITALFSDLAGFSTISEQFAAERLFAFLGEYLGEMTNILDGHGGTLDKFEGDAVVAFFGAPISFQDHALRSCYTAIDMVKRLEELNVEWQESGRYPELLRLAADRGYWKPIQVRVGLNSGLCAIGHLGTAERGNYTMMGDNVNLAARLEGVCKLYNIPICISEDTYLEVRDKVACREIDLIRVVGKTIPTRIYHVVGRHAELSSDQKLFLESFRQGMEAFKVRNFEEAARQFQEAKTYETWDWTTQLYIDRCQNYVVEPPPEDWDGVTDMSQK